MTFSFLISVISVGLVWYIVLVSLNWPGKIKFESYSGTKAMFCSSIFLPSASKIDTVLISFIWMICPAAITKLIFLALILINRLWLLQRWQEVHKSRNKIPLALTFYNCWSLTIKIVPIGPGTNGSELELSLCYLVLFLEARCTWFGMSLCPPLWPLRYIPLLHELPLCETSFWSW